MSVRFDCSLPRRQLGNGAGRFDEVNAARCRVEGAEER